MLLGSVSLAVAGRADCPTIVVRGDREQREGRFGCVLVGVDGTEQGAAAVSFAFQEAQRRDCEVRAVHAWHGGPEDQRIAQDVVEEVLAPAVAAHPAVRVSRETVEASARQVLLREAETADLLLVGAHHRTGTIGLHLGLTSHALLHHAPCPVGVIPQS
jgi:nucleotide-binding universal stress UspA family protein